MKSNTAMTHTSLAVAVVCPRSAVEAGLETGFRRIREFSHKTAAYEEQYHFAKLGERQQGARYVALHSVQRAGALPIDSKSL